MEYVAFSDESYSKDHNLASIASFSFRAENLTEVNDELKKLLKDSSVKEFKWTKLRDAKYRFCAEKLIEKIWKFIDSHDTRVDVIIWDLNDARHAVKNRDDMANYGRMFYHLHSSSLKRRPKSLTWKIYVDEGVGLDWDTVHKCLNASGSKRNRIELPIFAKNFFDEPHYKITDFQEIKSEEQPCCQIADLFAGMSIFSRIHYDDYTNWKSFYESQNTLFPQVEPNFHGAKKERFLVLYNFNKGCKERKLGVSLEKNRRLQTLDPTKPINFWHYEPQHELDKAPTKQ